MIEPTFRVVGDLERRLEAGMIEEKYFSIVRIRKV
jgi:hypothetical protein